MPGQGKYTAYYDQAFANNEDKKERLEAVFPHGVFTSNGPYNQSDVIKTGNERLLAIGDAESGTEYLQNGDPGMFPEGVYLDYRGVAQDDTRADLSTVKWEKAGDPMNPYVPDIRSPGPAPGIDLSDTSTDVINTNVDASQGDPRDQAPGELANTEQYKPNYDPADTDAEKYDNKGTRNPYYTARKIHEVAAVSVDKQLKLGDSMRHADE